MERILTLSNGEQIACTLLGQGTPLVCIHAPCIGSINFTSQQPLSDSYQLVLPDLPGHGRSSSLAKPFTIHDLTVCLHEIMGLLGHERPILLGYSQGASIALEYALCFPDKVQGLILVSAFSEVSDLYLHSRFYIAEAMASIHGVPLLARSITTSHVENPDMQETWIRHVSLTDADTLKHLYVAGHSYHCTDRLPEIHLPTLLVYGEEDRHMYRYRQLLHQGLPQAKSVIIPGVAHQVVTKASTELNRLCREFSNVKKGG
ncbi:alpha/beta hydrolase [Brevibacillus choshinensis]|uniref:alpha/beta fold hydrolase n=1 Tax=Brevibacillus choshinensis TaxID=54911 RepID=UPI002E1A2DFE|nr:alpha/beta hydrolase [Brevibacillus choshinensis]